MNIYQKLIELKKSTEGFSKDKKSYGYDYVSGSQILNKIKDKMNDLGLFLYPKINYDSFSWEKHEYLNGKGESKLDFIVTFQLIYTWINAEDPKEFIEVPWIGIGQQKDDIAKAGGTALTYNERYFLLKTFGLPTDMDDSDAIPPREAAAAGKAAGPGDFEIMELFTAAEAKGLTRAQVLAGCLKDYRKSIDKLSKDQFKKLKEKINSYETTI